MPQEFPWGVMAILGPGLIFVAYIIYYILRLDEEMKDEHDTTHRSDSEGS